MNMTDGIKYIKVKSSPLRKNKKISVKQNASIQTSIQECNVKGSVSFKTGSLKEKCQSVLQKYLLGEKSYARQEAHAIYKKHPGSIAAAHLWTMILYKDYRFKEAYAAVKKILEKSPDDANKYNLCGLIQRNLLLFDEAIASYKKAVELKPTFADPYNNMGIIYRYSGEREKAIKSFLKALALNPGFVSARYNLACMKGYVFSKEEISLVEKQREKLELPEDKARSDFTLYNALLKNNEFDRAFFYLEEGNRILFNNSKSPHILPGYAKIIIERFDENYGANLKKLGPISKKPIFIVGMPRSGSTLLEQILSSHSNVAGIGESHAMPKLIHSVYRKLEADTETFVKVFAETDEKQLEYLIREYEEKALQYVKNEAFFTDKMLNNFKYIGFIQSLIPQARFIHIKRNPIDTCLSCFEKKFTTGHEYTYDLDTLAKHFIAYSDLMKHWLKLYPELIYEINYEDIVSDTESQVRNCLSFLGLRMQKSCLEYYKNDRNVYTASTDQVREKINSNSIGKWRRYEKQLAPLVKRLSKAGIDID